MRIALTGANGYLGGRFSQYLSQKSRYEQVLFSRRGKSDSEGGYYQVLDYNDLASSRKKFLGVDVLVNFAGPNAQQCAQMIDEELSSHLDQTKKLVEIASESGVKRFIQISTAHIYGKALIGEVTEDTIPEPSHLYGLLHLQKENVVIEEAGKSSTMDAVVMRLSNTFGAPIDKNVNCWMLLVNDLCRQITESKRLVLSSPGLQWRDFLPVSLACQAIEHAFMMKMVSAKQPVYNLGGAWACTVYEMARFVQKHYEISEGSYVEIEKPAAGEKSPGDKLDYRVDLLEKTGIELNGQELAVDELNLLFYFCKRFFGNDKS